MDASEILKAKLFYEITNAQKTLDSARSCLADNDFAQCAVRLQMVGVAFTSLETDLIECITSD